VPPSLLSPPIAFGHRGARAHAPQHTVPALKLAEGVRASGDESDVWLTADGVPVLDHDGVVRNGMRRRTIPETARAQLPPHIPTLEELYAECGTGFHLSLDVKHDPAAAPVVDVAKAAGHDLTMLWLCHPDWEVAAGWRATLGDDVRLVDSTRLKRMKQGPERRAAQLHGAGIDCVNLHHTDWTGGLVALFHRFNRYTFGWDAQFERIIDGLVGIGIDGIFSDHVDRLVDVVAPSQQP
jgi:glycerophosphoryl diester phosphodiesterase